MILCKDTVRFPRLLPEIYDRAESNGKMISNLKRDLQHCAECHAHPVGFTEDVLK